MYHHPSCVTVITHYRRIIVCVIIIILPIRRHCGDLVDPCPGTILAQAGGPSLTASSLLHPPLHLLRHCFFRSTILHSASLIFVLTRVHVNIVVIITVVFDRLLVSIARA